MTPKSSFGGAFGLYNLGLTYYVFFYCHKMAPFQIYVSKGSEPIQPSI